MIELIKFVIGKVAEKLDLIDYAITEKGNNVDVVVTLEPSDMGKVIGKQGKLVKALRTIVRAGSLKENKKYNIEIKEKAE